MAAEFKKEIELEIAHVLFLDIVGYSKLSVNEQHARVDELNGIVRLSEQFQKAEAANRILKIPTGDGMALVFYKSPEEPAQCAFEISRALKDNQRLQVRMGIHSGPISGVVDVNERTNVAGGGINMAQRVMDCGDAGHILLSHHVAEDLAEYERWRPFLHDIGTFEVKHGARVSVTNLYDSEVGNSELPKKFQALKRHRARARWAAVAIGLLVVAAIIAAFVFLLRRPTRSAVAMAEKSIAVLPFENLSSDKENAYFADGIQDEILTRLSKIADLKVISRTSTQQYQSNPGNLSEIARQLGVAHILEGSVQKIANVVHVNVQLIRAATDEHLWAESYNRKLDDVFGVEGEVATAIAGALNARLTGAEQKDLAVRPTSNPDAYDAYLRGLAIALRTGALDLDIAKSITAFEEVVRLDPGFAAAWAWLSQQHAYAYLRGDHSPSQKEAAGSALETAIRLAPDAAETLTAQGFYRYRIERDYNGAREIFQRLREKSPNDPQATWALAAIARRQGLWDESLKLYEQAILISPRDGQTLNNAADTALAMRDWPAAQRLVDHALDISPGDQGALRRQVNLLQEKGEVERAQKILDGMPIAPGDTDAVFAFVTNAALTHAYAPAIALLKSQLEKPETLGVNLGNFQELLADMQRLAGDAEVAKSSYQEARATLKTALRVQPDSQELLSGLAAAEAGLGNQAEALAMARHAIELLPASKDAYIGPSYEESLARFQARFGDKDSAISALRHLLSISYGYPPLTVAMLRLDPDFDNLRDDPRFQKLITDGETLEAQAQTKP